MCVIYLLTPGCTARKDNGRMMVRNQSNELICSVPLEEVKSVVIRKGAQISTSAVYALLEAGAQLFYLDFRGNIMGQMGNEEVTLDRLLMQQICFSDDICQQKLIRYVINRKMKNQQMILRNYAKRKASSELVQLADEIEKYRQRLSSTEIVEKLRGLEGIASRCYFSAFPFMLDQNIWDWQGRNRRPPRDPVNSLLSYGYAFLEREIRSGIAGAHLDARFGFLHSNNGRKDSLVFDLMELFRQSVIDRFVLKLLNNRMVRPIDFSLNEDGACEMSSVIRKKWMQRYEEYMAMPQQSVGGKCFRAYIHDEIEEFAQKVWQMKILVS